MTNKHYALTIADITALIEQIERREGYSEKIVALEERLRQGDWSAYRDSEFLSAGERDALAREAYKLGLSRGYKSAQVERAHIR